jgi:uncharacterized protein (DUF1697 family)
VSRAVRTLLNSGNAVFDAPAGTPGKWAATLAAAIERRFGFPVPVIVLAARELATIVAENPLREANRDPSKFLVAFMSSRASLRRAEPLLRSSWSDERLAIGRRAAYVWCANGILRSELLPALGRLAGPALTTRNWATVLKLQAVVAERHDAASK